MLVRLLLAAGLLCTASVSAGAEIPEAPAAPSPQVPAESPPPVRLHGRITEKGTRIPLAAAVLVVEDERGVELGRAASDAEGRFAIAFAPTIGGKLTVVLAAADYRSARIIEKLAAGERLEVTYALRRTSYAQYESTVRARPVREEIARVSLTSEEVIRIPGVRADLLGAALNLPSVARPPFDAGQLIIRGAAPYQSGAFLGGLALPQPFHFGVATSTFNSYLIDRFELVPSNFSVRFGRFTGGVIDVVPRAGRSDRIHVGVKLDIIDAHIIVEGPIKKGSFALAFRRSYLDSFIGAVAPGLALVAPRYYDYQGLLDYPIAGGQLRLTVYGSDDLLGLVPSGSGNSLFGAPNQRFWFHTVLARYSRKWTNDELEVALATGPQHIETSGGAGGRLIQDLIEIDARVEYKHRIARNLKVVAGFDLQSRHLRLSLDGPPPATDDQIQYPGSVASQSLRDRGYRGSPAVYAQVEWQATRRLSIVAGVRADWFAGRRTTYAQPRLMARLEVARATYWKLGAGLFYQPPQTPFDNRLIGNPWLRAEQAVHLVTGVESRPFQRVPSLSFEANVFYKDLGNLPVASSDTISLDERVRPLRYSDEGLGRVYGGDLFIRQDSARWLYGWISYTLLRSERLDHPGQPGAAFRPFRFDQNHILTLVVGYHLPWDIDIGARFRYISGNPDTNLTTSGYDVTLDANTGNYVPRPGPLFGTRLPDFVQLDVRIDKRFVFRSWILSVYLDAYNATNRANAEGSSYSFDYSRRAITRGLPIIPSFGVRASY